ncbi:MAG: acyltransferase family protein [Candidatus Bathyarchaeota archaeon]|nr:acyltransferase family protein [Candidatus Bathyarchaeota archaeon]
MLESDAKKNDDAFFVPVDLIRVLAIVLVVVLHASNEYFTSMFQTPLSSDVYWLTAAVYKSVALPCVPLFIMLSGALLLRPSKTGEPIRVFLKKRCNRLGLAFIFWSIIYLLWSFLITDVPFTPSNMLHGFVRGLFTGPYYHFWFIYLLIGLYLITPVLRAVLAYRDCTKLLRYIALLWFAGVAVVPLIQLLTGYSLTSTVFVFGGGVGYFVLGVYLQNVKVRSRLLYGLFGLGVVWTVIATWAMSFPFNNLGQTYFFFDYFAANSILSSVALFLILNKFPANWPRSNHPHLSRLIKAISHNTLPIYLFHLIILESFQRGFFGFKLSLTNIGPIIGIPLLSVLTLFITLALVLVMKKVPILNKLIG